MILRIDKILAEIKAWNPTFTGHRIKAEEFQEFLEKMKIRKKYSEIVIWQKQSVKMMLMKVRANNLIK